MALDKAGTKRKENRDDSKTLTNSFVRPKRSRKKRRARVRSPKSKAPTYALTIMGKIIYRRLKRNPFISSGVSLVRQISSCSLLGWSGRLLKDATRNNRAISHENEENADLSPSTTSHEANESSRMTETPIDQHGSSTLPLNSNVNARPVSSLGQDIKHDTAGRSSSDAAQDAPAPNKKKRRARKVVRYRGLVARSIGTKGPKLREPCRVKIKAKNKVLGSLGRKSKRMIKENLVTRLSSRVRCKSAKADVDDETSGDVCTRGPRSSAAFSGLRKKTKDATRSEACLSAVGTSLSRGIDTSSTQAEAKIRVPRAAKQKMRKWRTLVGLGNAGGRSSTPVDKCRRKRGERRVKELKGRDDLQAGSQSGSRSSVASAQAKTQISLPETAEWPALPVSARVKGLAKEVATEIVMSKCSASIPKMTRKRWADIVSRGGKEPTVDNEDQIKEKRKTEQSPGGKTWASVAAADAGPAEKQVRKTPGSRVEQCSEKARPETPPIPGNAKRKKKKLECGLTYSDRIWLTCQRAKGKAHVQNFYRKHFGDGKDKPSKQNSNPASPRKKIVDKRREKAQASYQPPLPRSVTSLSHEALRSISVEKPSPQNNQYTKKTQVKCTSSNRDSRGQNACLVDNMPVVYTKKAGMVIRLNESNHDRRNVKDVNKCNNRAVVPRVSRVSTRSRSATSDVSVGLSSASGADLCSQLSSMTFQTPTASCYACTTEPSSTSSVAVKTTDAEDISRASSKNVLVPGKPISAAVNQAEGMLGRQKKMSLGYRALLRDSCGPLDARAVSDIHTRSRRVDTMQEGKAARRARRRRLRTEQQSTAHNSRRGPSGSAAGESRKPRQIQQPEQARQPGRRKQRHAREAIEPNQPNTRASSAAGAVRNENPTGSSTFLSPGQAVGSASSSTSAEGDIVWRPTDNNAANNSGQPGGRFKRPGNPTVMALRNHATQSVLTPVFAKSAPQLTEHPSNIKVELNTNLQTLDMCWWNAYLRQVNDS